MELDVEVHEVELFEMDPVYEHIAAPKYWDFGRKVSDEGTADKWFEDPSTEPVESPAAYHEPKSLLTTDAIYKNSRSLSGSPLRIRQRTGHPPTPGRAQRKPAIGPSPLRNSALSLNVNPAANISASPQNQPPTTILPSVDITIQVNVPIPPPVIPSPVKEEPVPVTEPAPENEPFNPPGLNQSETAPVKQTEESQPETEMATNIATANRPPLPHSAADAFAQAMGATLSESSQPLFMRRNKKPLEPLQTMTGGARRVAGRDLPARSKPVDTIKLQMNIAPQFENSEAMQENVGVGGQKQGQGRPPAGTKPGHVRLRSSRGRSLDDRSWNAITEVVGSKRKDESGESLVLQTKAGVQNKADAIGTKRSSLASETGVTKRQSVGAERRSVGGVRRSFGVMDENAKGGEQKLGARVRVGPTAVGRLKGRKSENLGLLRASSPRGEKVRLARKPRRSVQDLKSTAGGQVDHSVSELLEQRMNKLVIQEDRVEIKVANEISAKSDVEVVQPSSCEKPSASCQAPPSSIEKAGQLLRRMGAAVGALLGTVSPVEKQQPEGEEPSEPIAGVAHMLQFAGDEVEKVSKRESFLPPSNAPQLCTGVEPDQPEVSPRLEAVVKCKGRREKRQSLLWRFGGAGRKLREATFSPRGRAKKDAAAKKKTPSKAGNISHGRPLAVRLTLKEKERRLAVARRQAKLEEDAHKHALTMGWLRSSAAPSASLRPARPPAPPKVTQPHPFPLKTEERGAAKQLQWQAAMQNARQAEDAARIPTAHPLPFSLDVPQVPPKPVVKHSTVPAPFDLDSVKRHAAARARLDAELEKHVDNMRRTGPTKGRALSNNGAAAPFAAMRVSREADSFALHSDQRAAERRGFEQQMANKAAAVQREKEEREHQRKAREDAEVQALRRSLVVRAQPMPFFDKPFKPRKSTKELTVPHSPKFSLMSYQKTEKPALPPTWEELFMDHERP